MLPALSDVEAIAFLTHPKIVFVVRFLIEYGWHKNGHLQIQSFHIYEGVFGGSSGYGKSGPSVCLLALSA